MSIWAAGEVKSKLVKSDCSSLVDSLQHFSNRDILFWTSYTNIDFFSYSCYPFDKTTAIHRVIKVQKMMLHSVAQNNTQADLSRLTWAGWNKLNRLIYNSLPFIEEKAGSITTADIISALKYVRALICSAARWPSAVKKLPLFLWPAAGQSDWASWPPVK